MACAQIRIEIPNTIQPMHASVYDNRTLTMAGIGASIFGAVLSTPGQDTVNHVVRGGRCLHGSPNVTSTAMWVVFRWRKGASVCRGYHATSLALSTWT